MAQVNGYFTVYSWILCFSYNINKIKRYVLYMMHDETEKNIS